MTHHVCNAHIVYCLLHRLFVFSCNLPDCVIFAKQTTNFNTAIQNAAVVYAKDLSTVFG